ncbi:hypothetical membrane domain protein [Mycoplasmoides gallisepticum str. R(low)]|uniref:Hypothetical membrane domain protein n=2 Tax=Mycoplasmoides gallisepticum TaxID=2096 RepID=Q7NB64_MYCGA|nr:hypothetical protein [Mycoplasmoides gallisepticum]AAP56765.1 hypothetical membrane domain protein [Mycoplasmoides gallisepticum str. R(low)]ADC30618.1 hypothetical membrane domain protein [Mycoplasmoides gallisepticum str. R(high)]QEX45904.1 hypothetical protein F6J65_02085 [Mycoplasmoides gallisepticum]UQZ95604.1 hypothetical protein F9C22_02350 [Mycoplasmoides gallisepticum]SYV94594.1 hypothetical membrane domain protein [Mycoplasmoides gallisepticum]
MRIKDIYKIVNVTRRKLAILLLFLGTIIFASLSILILMNQTTANGQNNYIIYDKNKFKIPLFLPLIFFILVSVIALFILVSGKESYQFGDKLLSRKF